jgi:hypothetical protein
MGVGVGQYCCFGPASQSQATAWAAAHNAGMAELPVASPDLCTVPAIYGGGPAPPCTDGAPPPTIPPVTPPPPTISPPAGAPGSSCDNPLFIATCPPKGPSTRPPPPGPGTGPGGPPGGPPVGGPPGGSVCITDLLQLTNWAGQFQKFDPAGGISSFSDVVSGLPLVGQWIGQLINFVAGPLVAALGASPPCDSEIGPWLSRWVLGLFDKYLGPMPEAVKLLTYTINSTCPTGLPTAADAIGASLANAIDETTFGYWVQANDICQAHAAKLRYGERSKPSANELLQLWLRHYLNEGQVDQGLRNLGWIEPAEVAAVKQFAQVLPTPSDLVRFAVRHVFEPDLAKEFGFDDELNPQFVDWHSRLGFGYDVPIIDPKSGNKYNLNWAIAQWWSHWVWPSPTQAVQAGFRFRPDRDRSEEDDDTAALSVDQDAVRLLLRGNDYPPQFRSIIQGLGRPLPGVRQLARAVQGGDVDRGAIYEVFRKQGYSEFWSGVQADAIEQQGADQRLARVKRESGGAIEAAWDVGAVPDTNYLDYLQSLGLPIDQAAETLFFAQTKHLVERTKRRLRIFRAGFLKGRWDEQQMRTMLSEEGVVPGRIEEYLADWQLEITGRTREIARGELKRAACDGILPIADLTQRLLNLKWSPEDIYLTLQEVQLCLSQKEARLLSQQENQIARSQKAAQQAVAKSAAQLRAAQSALAKHGTPRELAKWYWEGTIPLDEVYARLAFLSWPDPDIERLLNDAMPSEARNLQRQQAAEKRHGSPAELAKWYSEGTISFEELVSRLRFFNWPDADIARLITEHGGNVPAGFPA